MLRLFVFFFAALAVTAPCVAGVPGRALAGNRPVGDAVVWLDVDAPSGKAHPRALMDQRNLTFIPHVLAVQAGTIVDFPNHDRVYHNVFSYHDGKRFDLGLYPVGENRPQQFDHPGIVRLFCNIHPNMGAYILVLNTPCFAVSQRNGQFELPQVRPGHYSFHAWRPGGEEIKGTAEIQTGRPFEVRWPR